MAPLNHTNNPLTSSTPTSFCILCCFFDCHPNKLIPYLISWPRITPLYYTIAYNTFKTISSYYALKIVILQPKCLVHKQHNTCSPQFPKTTPSYNTHNKIVLCLITLSATLKPKNLRHQGSLKKVNNLKDIVRLRANPN